MDRYCLCIGDDNSNCRVHEIKNNLNRTISLNNKNKSIRDK